MSAKLYSDLKSAASRNSKARVVRGFSMLELMIVIAIGVGVAAYAVPSFLNAYYNVRLRSAADDLSALMQQARITSARKNAVYGIAYKTTTTAEEACIDLNLNNTCDAGEPLLTFKPSITPLAGAPNGTSGTPSAYVLVGDSSTTNYDNATQLAFSPRGLPCAYVSSACTTPAAGYFVYYLKDQRPTTTGYAAVVVTKSGRTKTTFWNGSSWN